MNAYVLKRAALLIPTLLLVSVVIFLILRALPGDPAEMILNSGSGGSITRVGERDLAALRRRLGTDQPLPQQYLAWMGGLLTLDLGTSFVTGRPVLGELLGRLPVSAQLALMTVLFSTLFAIPAGVLSAIHVNSLYDYLLRFITKVGLSAPIFWTGTLVILGLALLVRWTPPLSYRNLWEDPSENLQQMIWPALVMGFYQTAILASMTRASVMAVLPEEFVKTARAKGLAESFVVRGHVLKNALLPVVTVAGLQFGSLLGGIVILEQIFAVPGVGRLLVDAIQSRDFPVVQATIVVFAASVALVNLLVDLLYAWLDPRIRFA